MPSSELLIVSKRRPLLEEGFLAMHVPLNMTATVIFYEIFSAILVIFNDTRRTNRDPLRY